MVINGDGNVGIGTTSPLYKLAIQNTADGNTLQVYDTDANCLMNPESSGFTTTCTSDARLKKDISNAGSVLSYLDNIPIRDFTVISSGERKTGVIAQELLTNYPELVQMGEDGFYGVSEIGSWKLIKGIQELDIKINSLASTTENLKINEQGNLVIGKTPSSSPLSGGAGGVDEPSVKIIDIAEITASSTQTALVVNQAGSGDVADFQNNGVSIINIDSSGQVKIVGSMLVDGRIMLCTGGNCSNALDAAADATQADLGVEGKVVAGAFEGYCEDGFIWVPGSAKYGTLPGFCVMNDLAGKTSPNPLLNKEGSANALPISKGEIKEGKAWTNISQGEAQIACQSLGAGYHLMGENEWLTMAENILQVAANDRDASAAGMQLATSTNTINKESAGGFALTNDNVINNLSGATAEWTSQNVTAAGLPVTPERDGWFEYGTVADYQGLNIAPEYYLTDQANNIGKIYIGSQPDLKGFVRGWGGIYGLDLSHAPDEKSADIGFRCAK